MRRLILLLMLFASMAFGYSYSGIWKNSSAVGYNEPVILKIGGNKVSPILQRGDRRVALKSKLTTNVGSGLFDVWGYGYKNLVLFIKPINSYKLRVVAKKVDTKRKRVVTKSFVFIKQQSPHSIKRQFIGNYKSSSNFSAIKKIAIRDIDGRLFVRAWRNTRDGLKALGVARAKIYNNRLHMTWDRGNLSVEATIRGYNYSRRINRYRNLELYVKATNLRTGLTNTQTIQLRRGDVDIPPRPIYKKLKIGPVDVNLMMNSY